MAETILFEIAAPENGKAPAHRVLWYQSNDGETWGEAINSILLSECQVDPESGLYSWASSSADPTKYHTLRTESANGVINESGPALPPRYQFPVCEIYVEVKDLELQPVASVPFTFIPREAPVRGVVFDMRAQERSTDGDGLISIFVPQGMAFDVSSPAMGGKTVAVRTDGRAFINLSYTMG